MKVALLSAIVFGAISVAATTSGAIDPNYEVQQHRRARSNNAGAKKESHQKRDTAAHPGVPSEHVLSRRGETSGMLGLAEGAADLLRGGRGDAQKAGDTIVHNHLTPPPAYHPPPAYGAAAYGHAQGAADPMLAQKLEKIDKHINKIKQSNAHTAEQVAVMQEIQAKQIMSAKEAQAAAAQGAGKKRGIGKGWLFGAAAGGIGLGYVGTKMFDTKPADTTTGYSPEEMQALQAAGGAAPGTIPVDGSAGSGRRGRHAAYDGWWCRVLGPSSWCRCWCWRCPAGCCSSQPGRCTGRHQAHLRSRGADVLRHGSGRWPAADQVLHRPQHRLPHQLGHL